MQRNYDKEMAKAVPGLLHGEGDGKIDIFVNSAGLMMDTWEVAIPAAPTADTLYSVTVNGNTASFKTSPTPTQAELQSGLFAAMRTSPTFTTSAEAVIDPSSSRITITSRFTNTPLDVRVTPPDLTLTHVTATPAELRTIPFGRVVARKPGYDYKQASLVNDLTDQILGITVSTHAIAQVESYTPTTYLAPIKSAVGYKPLDTMNVLVRSSELTGIYTVVVPDETISLQDRPYVSISPGTEGMVTKSATNSIPIFSIAKFERSSSIELGVNLVLLSFNN